MPNDYDQITAYHYSAYRPALHFPILESCLREAYFEKGLDIGCGTGHSSIALANFCNEITAIEPSSDMLNKTIFNKKVNYLHWNAKELPFPNDYFDVVTLAGSWFYAQSQALLDDIARVTQFKGKVLLYDFDVQLGEMLVQLNIPKVEAAYDHQVNFSKLEASQFQKVDQQKIAKTFSITSLELSHLVLSVKENYSFLSKKWKENEILIQVESAIRSHLLSTEGKLSTYIYSTLYQKT